MGLSVCFYSWETVKADDGRGREEAHKVSVSEAFM